MLVAGERTIRTTKLLAKSTGPSDTVSPAAAASPTTEQPAAANPAVETPLPAVQEPLTEGLQPGTSPLLFRGEQSLEEPEGGLLEDQTLEGLDVPPEPSPGFEQRYRPVSQPAASPIPSMFPGRSLKTLSANIK